MPQTMQHEPGSPVLAAKLSLQLFGTEPWRMRCHQVSHPKPFLDTHMATMHRRASHRRRTSAAGSAFIPKWFLDNPISPAITVRADEAIRPSAFRQVFSASSVRTELLPKLAKCFWKCWSNHASTIHQSATLVKYISIFRHFKF